MTSLRRKPRCQPGRNVAVASIAASDSLSVMRGSPVVVVEGEREVSDEDVVRSVVAGDRESFAVLVRRHNQSLFRACRAVIGDDGEAEDAVQAAWISAFRALSSFRGEARFRTWVTRIAVREASARVRKRQAHDVVPLSIDRPSPSENPEHDAFNGEIGRVIEHELEFISPALRSVVVLRDVMELDTAETAACLGINEDAVRVRLHRGRSELARRVAQRAPELAGGMTQVWRFAGERCQRIQDRVMAAIAS